MKLNAAIMAGIICTAAMLTAGADRPAPRRGQAAGSTNALQPASPKVTRVGDVRLSGYTRLSFGTDLSTVHVVGPNTMVDVPEKGNGSRLRVHADDITLSGANKPGEGHLEMRGNLHYTMTQPTASGERKLVGTAGQGDYRRDTRKLVLSNGVRGQLTDPGLDGPGILRAGTVTVDAAASPHIYTLNGDSATNDVQFTPRPPAAKRPPPGQKAADRDPETEIGAVHFTHWDAGMFQAGKIAKFDGVLVIADLQARAGSARGQLKARHIEGDFANTGGITRARATEDVHYHIERSVVRKLAEGKTERGRQEVTGTSNEALYEPEARRLTLDGVDAAVVNTLSLAEPARLLASRLVVTESADANNRGAFKFELAGTPNHRRLAFTPRPPEPAPPAADGKPAPGPVFTLGSIVLTGFQTGVMEPGQKIDLTSDGTQMLMLDTADTKTHSASHIETHHFRATLTETGAITEARTDGPVTFHIQQPGPVRETKSAVGAAARPQPGVIQSLDGSAARAVYQGGAQGRSIALQGPFTAKVTDPEHLQGPGNVKGQKDDTLSLDLLSREFTFDSPHETIVLDFVPRPPEPDKTAPTATAGKGKK